MGMNIFLFLIFSIVAYWLFSELQKFNLTRKINSTSEINSTSKTDQVLSEAYMKQLLGIGQITRKKGTLIMKILKNYLDETSCPQNNTDYKFPNNGEILSLLKIYKQMIQYYYDISNESKKGIAILKNSLSELKNKLDELMENSPQSICKIEYNKYTVNKSSNYQRFLKIFEYVSLIQYDISTSVDILQSREYFQNYQEARDKAKKYISQSLAILGQIKKKNDLKKKKLEKINQEILENIEQAENLTSTDEVISIAENIYSIFQKLDECGKKYKELIHCHREKNEINKLLTLHNSFREIYVETALALFTNLLYIYNNLRKEIFFENFRAEILKIGKEVEERYNKLNAMSCQPAKSNGYLGGCPRQIEEYTDVLLKNFQSISIILHKDFDFIRNMKSVIYTNSLNISTEIEKLLVYAEFLDYYQYDCSSCPEELKDLRAIYNALENIRPYGQRKQLFHTLHELISIVNSNYDTISNCYINEKNNIIHDLNEIKRVATHFNVAFKVSVTIEIAEKFNEEALISLKNVKSAAKNCQKRNMTPTNEENVSNQTIKSFVHGSFVFFDKSLNYLNEKCLVFVEEGFNDLLCRFGKSFENLNTAANDITEFTDFELQNTLDKVHRFTDEIVEDEMEVQLDKRDTKLNEKYNNRLTSFINDFQKLNEIIVCGVSEGGAPEITKNVNVSKLVGNVISLFECYLGALFGNETEYAKLVNDDERSDDDKRTTPNCNPKPEVAKDTNVLIANILKTIFIILKDSTPSLEAEVCIYYSYYKKTKLNMQTIQDLFQFFKFFEKNDNLAQRVKQSLLLVWKDFKQLELNVHMKEETIEINMEEEMNFEETTISQSPSSGKSS